MKKFPPKADQLQAEKIKICPVCVAVSLTWFLISAGIAAGLLESENWRLIVAIAMGGTAVGIAFQAEKRFGWHSPMIKFIIIVIGFVLAYLAVSNINLWTLTAEAIIILALGYLFFVFGVGGGTNAPDSKKLKELEEKMKDCC